MTATFQPSRDQSRALVNGHRHDRLESIHYPYKFKVPYTPEHYWHVDDDDYSPLPWEKREQI